MSDGQPTFDELRLLAACGITVYGELTRGLPIDVETASGIVGSLSRLWLARVGEKALGAALDARAIQADAIVLLASPEAVSGPPSYAEMRVLALTALHLVDALGAKDEPRIAKCVLLMGSVRGALLRRYGAAHLLPLFSGDDLSALYNAIPIEHRERPS